MRLTALFFLSLPLLILGQIQSDGASFVSPIKVAPGLSASVVFSNLTSPRGVVFDSQKNLLVVERGLGVSMFTRTLTPTSGWSRKTIIKNAQLTHGIQINGNTLYVSTASEVLAYSYDPTTGTASSTGSILISGLPADGELITHTLQLVHDSGTVTGILVGSGPKTNIDITARDSASGRSQVRFFSFLTAQPYPLAWTNGAVVAYGVRNPAGLAFVSSTQASPIASQTLLIVENGASIENVTTKAFANDNPADEIESLTILSGSSNPAPYFGFPDCATLWNGAADTVGESQYKGLLRGAQFSLRIPDPTGVIPRDDAWCQDTTNNRPPAFNFQAHSVPLDIKRYEPGTTVNAGGLPSAWSGDVFVSFHGSFDRTPPTGYGVVHVPFPFNTTLSPSDLGYDFLIQAADLSSCPGKCIRPVGLVFGPDDRLYATSDNTGELFVIQGLLTP